MRLALQTDYALRVLIYLASRGGRVTAGEIARFYAISNPHVSKVVNQLARHGFIRSIRGTGGGLELARPAAEITVGEVVLNFEGNMHLLECVATSNVCVIQPFCKLRRVLGEAERRQMEYLNGVVIADVIPTRRQMSEVSD